MLEGNIQGVSSLVTHELTNGLILRYFIGLLTLFVIT